MKMQPHLYHAILACPFTAKEAFMRLKQEPGCVWLDSVRSNPHGDGRFSLVAANPLGRLRFCGGRLEHIRYDSQSTGENTPATTEVLEGISPLVALEQWLASFGKRPQHRASQHKPTHAGQPAVPTPAAAKGLDANTDEPVASTNKDTDTDTDNSANTNSHGDVNASKDTSTGTDLLAFFNGGAVGYFSYEFGRHWERHTALPSVTPDFPQMDWALYDAGVVCDHQHGTTCIVACSILSEAEAREKAHTLLDLLLKASPQVPVLALTSAQTIALQASHSTAQPTQQKIPHPQHFANNASDSDARRSAYMRAVEKTRAYIAQGDIYQTNIVQHFNAPLREAPSDLYLRLRDLNPAPYAAFIDTGNFQILSSSPELFLHTHGRDVRTRPIKGTRPRAHDPVADERLRTELFHSEKERAELLMIVDLERNDLGRICEPGSVRVESLYRVETYATVHHLVADVCGTIKAGTTLADVLHATFPGGSITGAPKVRAMEIIDELEQRERGICCGAIGLIRLCGSLNLNIAIRTLLCAQTNAGPVVSAGVGAGLVWDSVPQLEYEETLHKAEALLKAINTQPRY